MELTRPQQNGNYPMVKSREAKKKVKKDPGCWAKFKNIFEDRGFEQVVEYGEYRQQLPEPSTRRTEAEKIEIEDELSGVINFYEQFAVFGGDDVKEKEEWRRSSGSKRRETHKVSLRPSVYLTNIAEESSLASIEDMEDDYMNRSTPPASIPPSLIYAPSEPLELLCVFPERGSRVCAAACAAAARAGGDARAVRVAREALDALARRDADARVPHVVVIDGRLQQTLDAMQLARTIRGAKNTQHLILIAVVKKSAYLKDDFSVIPYLEAGFNRVMVETLGGAAWCAEVLQARAQAASARAQLGALAALVAAVDRCKDLVVITDDQQRLLMSNKSWCRALGWRAEDTPRPLAEVAGGEALRLTASGARDWEAPLALRRRGAPDPLLLPCRGAAVGVASNSHVVLVCESGVEAAGAARGSIHSIRRTSLDVRSVASDGLRRTSLAKLQGLPLEAPITKVISLLAAAIEGASPSTVGLVERAVDMLRTSELYSPQMRDDSRIRPEDPIATDLIGALLSRELNSLVYTMQGPTNVLSSRRSSNDSTVVRAVANRQNIKHKAPSQLRELLETSLNWDFEIFRLEKLTCSRPLSHLGLWLANRFDVCYVLECDERTVLNWLTVIEMNYHTVNTYHNSTHAADVMQAVAYFMEKERLKSLLEPLEAVAALIAAATHDIDHPGMSSAFLCNSRHSLAILYNDLTVLESHHAALTFKLTLNDERVNIFKNLDRETYKTLRHNIIDMILATEMTKHFEHLAKFVSVFYAKTAGSKEDGMQTDEPLALDTAALSMPDNIVLVKRMMIKCADVSNASRPQKFAFEWARRIAEEYFLQTDEEKSKELPVVMPMFDRATCSIPRSQIGFIDFIIIDMMEAWSAFIEMPELVQHARANYNRWRELDDQGVSSLDEVRRAQNRHNSAAGIAANTTAEEE